MGFENKMTELETILKRMESSDVTLEESVKLFESGVSVARDCLDDLNKNKSKIDGIKAELDRVLGEDELI